jgi:peroxiredoxin
MRSLCLPTMLIACLTLTSVNPAARGAEAPEPASSIGKRLEPFALRDFRGKKHALADFDNQPILVVAFLGTECPLALQYAPRLVELSEKFAPRGVAFVGIDANQQDSISELAQYAKIHDIKFPLLKDVGNHVADQLGATRTPEVFVVDRQRIVRYRGRIDDQYLVGRQRKAATREDLATALEELLAGKLVSQNVTDAPGCRIGRVHKADPAAAVNYSKHVAPLLNTHCVECHRPGQIAPFALTSYAEAAGWAETMLEVVNDNRMPPWHASPEYGHFSNDCRLSDAEKQTLATWVAAGAPEGNPRDLPAPPVYAEGWRLPRVDREFFISETAIDVPAEGTVGYKHLVVDPGFTEDTWVQGAECKAGNPAVVHHIIMFTRGGKARDNKRRGDGGIGDGFVTATAPGAHPLLLGDGLAKRIPAGAKLVFQMHYTPNGSPQQDRSRVGLMLADPAQVRKEVKTYSVDTHLLFIPPRTPDYELDAWHTLRSDVQVLSFFPHMHLRGMAFRYEAQYPDGTKEILLDVPRYDFAWQQTYQLAEPKLIPKGTKLRCTAHYDNSVDNVANPNPNIFVHWGEQTWDEMLMGFLDYTTPDEVRSAALTAPAAPK